MKSISLSKKESWSSEAPVPPSTIKSLGRRAFDCGRDLESFLAVRSKGERDADERWRVGGKGPEEPLGLTRHPKVDDFHAVPVNLPGETHLCEWRVARDLG